MGRGNKKGVSFPVIRLKESSCYGQCCKFMDRLISHPLSPPFCQFDPKGQITCKSLADIRSLLLADGYVDVDSFIGDLRQIWRDVVALYGDAPLGIAARIFERKTDRFTLETRLDPNSWWLVARASVNELSRALNETVGHPAVELLPDDDATFLLESLGRPGAITTQVADILRTDIPNLKDGASIDLDTVSRGARLAMAVALAAPAI